MNEGAHVEEWTSSTEMKLFELKRYGTCREDEYSHTPLTIIGKRKLLGWKRRRWCKSLETLMI